MSGAFSRYQYFQVLDEIETHLGYLKGNELCHEYLRRVETEIPEEGVLWPIRYETPAPQHSWERLIHIYPANGVDATQLEAQIKSNADQAWRNGAVWAQGVADYARQITDQITEPDVGALTEAVRDLQRDVVNELTQVVDDDWAHLGGIQALWQGRAAAEFRNLYDNFNERLQLYGYFSAGATMGMAASAVVIAAAQDGLLPFVEELRDHARSMVERWRGGYPPRDAASVELPTWVGEVWATIGDGLSIVAGGGRLEAAQSLYRRANALLNIVDRHAPEVTHRSFAAADADTLYTTLTGTLNTDYLQRYRAAFDELSTGASQIDPGGNLEQETFSGNDLLGSLNDLGSRGWLLPEVPATESLSGSTPYRDI